MERNHRTVIAPDEISTPFCAVNGNWSVMSLLNGITLLNMRRRNDGRVCEKKINFYSYFFVPIILRGIFRLRGKKLKRTRIPRTEIFSKVIIKLMCPVGARG